MVRTGWKVAMALVLVAVLGLGAACSDDDGDEPAATTTSTVAPTTTSMPTTTSTATTSTTEATTSTTEASTSSTAGGEDPGDGSGDDLDAAIGACVGGDADACFTIGAAGVAMPVAIDDGNDWSTAPDAVLAEQCFLSGVPVACWEAGRRGLSRPAT